MVGSRRRCRPADVPIVFQRQVVVAAFTAGDLKSCHRSISPTKKKANSRWLAAARYPGLLPEDH